MRKTLSGGIEQLAKRKKPKIADNDKGNILENLTEAVKKLLQSCLSLQEELYDVSTHAHEVDIPPHYYKQYLHWTQSLIAEVGSLVNGVSQINTKHAEDSTLHGSDLRYRSELLWRPTSRIAELCVQNEGLSNALHEMKYKRASNANSNNNNNVSSEETEDSEWDGLQKAVQSAARTVQENLREIIELSDASFSKNRPKRILPTSPSLLYSKEYLTSSFAVKNTVSNWLQDDTCASFNVDRSQNSNSSFYV
uniref:Uncharacterized protein n=1 Tax=Ciona savignyi TaxID=51511 RepID=H2ZIT6_CIOSA